METPAGNTSQTKKQKVEQMAIDTYIGHIATFISLRERFQALMDRYENKLRAGSITAKSEVKAALGAAFSLVENGLPRIIGRKPKYRYAARENGDVKPAEIYDEFSEYQFDEAEVQDELEEIAKWGLATGLSGYEMGWKTETRVTNKAAKEVPVIGYKITNPLALKALKLSGLDKKMKDATVEEEKTVSNYTVTAIKPADLIWTPSSRKIKDAPVKGYKSVKKIITLKQEGFDVEPLMGQLKSKDTDQERADSQDGIADATKVMLMEEQEVDVAKLYVDFPNENGMVESWVVTLGCISGGSPVSIGTQENPLNDKFVPMSFFIPIRRPGKAYGFGLIEPSIGVLDAEEDGFNMALEAEWTATVPPIELNPANIIDMATFKYGPRQIMAVRNLGQSLNVTQSVRPNAGSYQFFQDYLNRAKQNITGITDYQTGANQSKGDQTLGEIQIKTEESNSRMGQIQANFDRQIIQTLGENALRFNKQFLKDQKDLVFRIVGKKGSVTEKEISFDDIEAIKDIISVPGSTALASQSMELARWTNLLTQAREEEATLKPVPIDKEPIWERLLEHGYRVQDPETFLPSLKEREQAEVGGKEAQIQDAKEENAQPINARVLPTDADDVHIPIHNAEIERRSRELEMADQQGMEVPPEVQEELQMLVQHRDDHVAKAGGVNPGAVPEGAPQPQKPM